jgi:hypothetical protein
MHRNLLLLLLGPLAVVGSRSPARADPPSGHRAPVVVLQFDDGHITHHTIAWPILQTYGLPGSFGIVTGNVGTPSAMSGAMIRELFDAGCSLQDHTKDHNAAKWGSAAYASEWGPDILYSQAVFRDSVFADLAALDPDRVMWVDAWNQPGGAGEGFPPELGDSLAHYGYRYTAGAISLQIPQIMNFHRGLLDNPFRLGRGLGSWKTNAPSAGWTWEIELAAVKRRIADCVAAGAVAAPLFHIIDADAQNGLEALCAWIVDAGLIALNMDDAVAYAQAPHDDDYGHNIAAPLGGGLTLDRNHDGLADGWGKSLADVDTSGMTLNYTETTIYGPPPGYLVINCTVNEVLLNPGWPDPFNIDYTTTHIDPNTFAYTTHVEQREYTLTGGESFSYTDTLEIDEHDDRVRSYWTGFWKYPYRIESFSAVPIQIATGVTGRTPRAGLAVAITPNPTQGVTAIAFHLDEPTPTSVEIFDVAGRLVERIVNRQQLVGDVRLQWRSDRVASGVYFARVTAGNAATTGKITLVK